MPVGTILSLNGLGPMAQVFGWRGAVLLSGALALVALVCFLALYRPAPAGCSMKIQQREHLSPAAIPKLGLPIWLVGAIWMLFNAAVISFLTFSPDYFLVRGYGLAFAGFLASLLMLPSPLLAPLIGHLLDKRAHEELITGLGGLLIASSIFAIAATSLPLLALLALLVCLGVGAALVPTPVFALPAKMLPPEHVGTGYGIVSTCLNVGVVAGPYLGGLARDITGAYQLTFYLVSLFAALVAVVAGTLYLTRQRMLHSLILAKQDSSPRALNS
jgi:MFS family permease